MKGLYRGLKGSLKGLYRGLKGTLKGLFRGCVGSLGPGTQKSPGYMNHVFYTKISHIRVSKNEGFLFWMKIVGSLFLMEIEKFYGPTNFVLKL